MKKTIKMVFVVLMSLIILSASAFAASFSDTQGHWAEHYIERMADAKYVNGYPDGSFNPDGVMTRAEFAKVVSAVYGLPQSGVGHRLFNDVAQTDWYMPYSVAGYLVFPPENSTGALSFRGNNQITRLEAAYAMVALYNCKENKTAAAQMSDYAQYSSDAFVTKVVSTAIENSIMQGKGEAGFQPYATLTRAELCTLVMRTFDQKGNADDVTIKELSDFISGLEK